MIVKMKFLCISGPREDIDRVCDVYLSKHEMQLENAVAELRTTDNLLPFVEVNPYKEPLAKAEQFCAMISEGKGTVDTNYSDDEMITIIRDVNYEYLKMTEGIEQLKKKKEASKAKELLLEPFVTLQLDLQQVSRYQYMKVRFGRIATDYYQRFEKYMYHELNAIFLESSRNDQYVYGCYFASNADVGKADSVLKSLHFERIAFAEDFVGTPEEQVHE